MAYLKDIDQACAKCPERARVALVIERPYTREEGGTSVRVAAGVHGYYCRPCGKEALRAAEKHEPQPAMPDATT